MMRSGPGVVTVAAFLAAFSCRSEPVTQAPANEAPAASASTESTAPGDTAAQPNILSTPAPDPMTWEQAVAKVEEVRGGGAPVKVPAELQHYSDRRRFLAIQYADAEGNKFDLPHDLGDLAVMIRKGEMAELPKLGEDHILYEVGEDAHEDPLEHWDPETGQDVPLVGSEEQLAGVMSSATPAFKQTLERHYGDPQKRQALFAEYQAVTALAKDFGGRSYDLNDAAQRAEFQQRMLSFLRPEARKVALEIARGYHAQFQRPLPITSIIRTQRYQRSLSRVNPNATKIEVPPHTTGMAFDISYKFMSPAEQTWVMDEVARLERGDRVEALREKRNHIHIYAFAKQAPADVMVAKYLDDIGPARVERARATPTRKKAVTTRTKSRSASKTRSTRSRPAARKSTRSR